MKHLVLILIALLSQCFVAVGQEQSTAQGKPDIKRFEPQSQPELAEAQRQANEARTAAEAAAARYETAQQRVLTVLYRVMAEMKLSPKEWQVKQDQAGIYFEKLKPEPVTKAEKAP